MDKGKDKIIHELKQMWLEQNMTHSYYKKQNYLLLV